MKASKILFLLMVSLVFMSAASPSFSASTPYLIDNAKLLSPDEQTSLKNLLTAHNNSNLIGEIYVQTQLVLKPGTTIEKEALQKINEILPVPSKRVDRILVLIYSESRQMRIETSRDVWKIVPDSFCKKVINDIGIPAFKKKQFFSGIQGIVKALVGQLELSGPKKVSALR